MYKIIKILLPILMFKFIIISASCTITYGPAVKPDELSKMTDAELIKVDMESLCIGYKKLKTEKVKYYLDNKGYMTESDWSAIENGRLEVGLSECALYIGFKTTIYCGVRSSAQSKDGSTASRWECEFGPWYASDPPKTYDVDVVNSKVIEIRKHGFLERALKNMY